MSKMGPKEMMLRDMRERARTERTPPPKAKPRPDRVAAESVTRLEKAGYRAEVLHADEIDQQLRAQLETIARTWRSPADATSSSGATAA